jgi:hypothetical protein
MGMDETFVIPVKLRWPTAMFTLREIFYNGKPSRSLERSSQAKVRENPVLRFKH